MKKTPTTNTLSRRELIVGATSLGLLATGGLGCQTSQNLDKKESQMTKSRMPTIFLPHGGGPWPFMAPGTFGPAGTWTAMEAYLRGLSVNLPEQPKAVLVISAHWEENVPTIQSAAAPPLLYDYSGFPPETYALSWPAPGLPELAGEIREALETAGIPSAEDGSRGFDHGVFVPLKLAYPDAKVPTLELSLKRGLDPMEHVKIGRALASLRERGVLILGSGMSYHNLSAMRRAFRGIGKKEMLADSYAFDGWIEEAISGDATQLERHMVEWEKAPAARACHPREEHLVPLMVVAGAAGDDRGSMPYREVIMHAQVSAVHFG